MEMESESIKQDAQKDINSSSTDLQKQTKQQKACQININPNRKKYGKMVVITTKPFLITLGPDYICFLLAFVFFCGISYLLCSTVEKIIWLAYIISVGQCGSYLLVALSNPGIALRQDNPIKTITEYNKHKICKKCGAFLLRKTYHCWDCDVCVQGYDHHCPWTSKCIGKNNLCPFYMFITITPIFFICFMGLMMACLVVNAQNQVKRKHLKTHL